MTESDASNADLGALKINRDGPARRPGRWKRWLHLLWLLLPVVLYFAYQKTMHEVRPSTKVRVAAVELMQGSGAAAELVATGYVVAQVKAAVASKATGRLRILNVEEGDLVQRNDTLAELDNEDIKAELAVTRANLKLARADSVAADLNYQRQSKLLATGHTTEAVFEEATARYHRGMANVEAALAAVRAAEVARDNTYIIAPFDGTVLTKHADVGEMVAPFASASSSKGAVVTLADMLSLEVEADVSESNIQKVVVGAPCEIVLDAYPEATYAGYVKKIVPTADRARATVMTKIAFDDLDQRVLPEMSARVNFLPERDEPAEAAAPITVVAKKALTTRDGKPVVFVVTAGIAVVTPVQTGRQLGDVTEVLSGIEVGQKVILSPAGGLSDGDKVEITI